MDFHAMLRLIIYLYDSLVQTFNDCLARQKLSLLAGS
jgi:hypothetical protein